jgi:hypothetical protein
MDEHFLTCPMCLELATEPRETNCCHQLFCLSCIQLPRQCPICRADRLTYSENVLVARLLDAFPATCPFGCSSAVTRGNLEEHTKKCDRNTEKCDSKWPPFTWSVAHSLATVYILRLEFSLRSFAFVTVVEYINTKIVIPPGLEPDLMVDCQLYEWRISSWRSLERRVTGPEFEVGGYKW